MKMLNRLKEAYKGFLEEENDDIEEMKAMLRGIGIDIDGLCDNVEKQIEDYRKFMRENHTGEVEE